MRPEPLLREPRARVFGIMRYMEEIISKEELDELMKLKDEIRGGSLKNAGDFVLAKRGEKGLKRLEEEMGKLGYKIKFEEVHEIKLYPLGLPSLV